MIKSNYSSIDLIINIAKKGGMFILVDDEKRENEGDLVISTSDINAKKPHGTVTHCYTRKRDFSSARARQFYSLRNIPYGKYEMIISMIGYEVIKQDVFVFDNERISMNFILVPEPIQMKEVIVTAKSNKLWKKNLAIFNRIFLGDSKICQACKILN